VDNVEPDQPCDEYGEIKLSHYGLERSHQSFGRPQSEHNSFRVCDASRLSFGCDRFAERENFRHNRLDFPGVD
jgi:hypothetical protein